MANNAIIASTHEVEGSQPAIEQTLAKAIEAKHKFHDLSQPRRKGLKESLMHLPEKLRELLVEHVMMSQNTPDMPVEKEITVLQPLAEYYEKQYETQPDLTGANRLCAFALWMACSLRNPKNSKYMESAIKLMNCKLSLQQLVPIKELNKALLREYRDTHTKLSRHVHSSSSNINTCKWSDNLAFMSSFTSDVNYLSDVVSRDLRRFLARILDQCVESLGEPPCGVAVIAIGHLARGELTSYSEIDYSFIIEQSSDDNLQYFRQLAFLSKASVCMLGESNLASYRIRELIAMGFKDRFKKGLSAKKACERDSIFTMEHWISYCESVMEGKQKECVPEADPGGMSELLPHRSLIWSFGNGKDLYKAMGESFKSFPIPLAKRMESLKALREELEKGNFLPELLTAFYQGHQHVKVETFRYILLLLSGLNSALDLRLETNWQVIEKVVSTGQWAERTRSILSFLYASSFFITFECHDLYGVQRDKISLLLLNQSIYKQYSCPPELFMLMMSYLLPLKSQIEASSFMNVPDVKILPLRQDMFTSVCLSHYYRQDYEKLIDEFTTKFGGEIIFGKFDGLLKLRKSITQVSVELLLAAMRICGFLRDEHTAAVAALAKLYPNMDEYEVQFYCCLQSNPSQALVCADNYLKKPSFDCQGKLWGHLLIAKCHKAMENIGKCEKVLTSSESALKEMMNEAECTPDHVRYLATVRYLEELAELKYDREDYVESLKIFFKILDVTEKSCGFEAPHIDMERILTAIAIVYHHLKLYQSSLEYLTKSLDISHQLYTSFGDRRSIANTLMWRGIVKKSMGEFGQAMDSLFASYQMMIRLHSNTGSMQPCMFHWCVREIALCHCNMSANEEAIQWCTQQYDKLKTSSQMDTNGFAICTETMGECYMNLKKYKLAIDSFAESLSHRNEVDQSNSYNRKLTSILGRIGECHYELSEYQQALSSFLQSIEIYKVINQDGKYDEDLRDTIQQVALCHFSMFEYEETLHWSKQEYSILKESIIVDDKQIAGCCSNIGQCYIQLKEYKLAVESFIECVSHYAEINQGGYYDEELKNAIQQIALCYNKMSEFKDALDWTKQEYTILKDSIIADNKQRALCSLNIGYCHMQLEEYKLAVESFLESLKYYREINQDGKYDKELLKTTQQIASCYYSMLEFQDALEWYKQEHTILIEAVTADDKQLAVCAACMGHCYLQMKEYKSALETLLESLGHYKEVNHDRKYDHDVADIFERIAMCHYQLSYYKEAIKWYQLGYKHQTDFDPVQNHSLAGCAMGIGNCHLELNDYKSAMNSYLQALKSYKESSSNGAFEAHQADAIRLIAKCHLGMFNYGEALQWLMEGYSILDKADVADKQRLAEFSECIGDRHLDMDKVASGIAWLKKSLKLYKEINQDRKYLTEIKRLNSRLKGCVLM